MDEITLEEQKRAEQYKGMSIQEILNTMYAATDIVYVTNPTNKPYRWEQGGGDVRDERNRISRKIDTYEVLPGAEVALPAFAATLYIDYMVKQQFGLERKPGNILQPHLVLKAINKVFIGANRGSEMLDKLRVSTINDRAGVPQPAPYQAAPQPATPAPQSGEFDLADIGLSAENIESPIGEDPDLVPVNEYPQPTAPQAPVAPVTHDPLAGLNNPTD